MSKSTILVLKHGATFLNYLSGWARARSFYTGSEGQERYNRTLVQDFKNILQVRHLNSLNFDEGSHDYATLIAHIIHTFIVGSSLQYSDVSIFYRQPPAII